jgi:hypothetical protein
LLTAALNPLSRYSTTYLGAIGAYGAISYLKWLNCLSTNSAS